MKLNNSIDCKHGAVRAVRYNVDGDYILSCGSHKTVKLWKTQSLVSKKEASNDMYLKLCLRFALMI